MRQLHVRGIYRTADLLERGLSRHRIDRLVDADRLKRIRQGWYSDDSARPEVVQAVKRGGALTCLSACELYGLWVPEAHGLHVAVTSPVPGNQQGAKVYFHPIRTAPSKAVLPLEIAIEHVIRYHDRESALVVMESALQAEYFTFSSAKEFLNTCGHKGRRVAKHLSGLDQSGSETRVRLFVRSKRIAIRSQVFIPNVGRVDLVVGKSLIIECDSRAHHSKGDGYESDRRRDLRARELGYQVIRLSYAQIWRDWEQTQRFLQAVLATGVYRKSPVALKLG